jgi:hypothetical protein
MISHIPRREDLPGVDCLPQTWIYTPETIPKIPLTLLNIPGAENRA